MLDTGVAIVRGAGDLNLRDQRIDYRISARPKHFSIGSISTPIDITGTLGDPSIRPAIAPLAERGAVATALGFVAPPLALLATIQLGVDDPHQSPTSSTRPNRKRAPGRKEHRCHPSGPRRHRATPRLRRQTPDAASRTT